MEIKELRIGNYISPLGIGFTKVEGFCIWDNLIQSSNFAERGIEDFEPILLTEEWLLKFGFEQYIDFGMKTGVFYLIPLQGFSYSISKKSCMIMHRDNPSSHRLKKEYKYVHELQNLYFALTGTELTVA